MGKNIKLPLEAGFTTLCNHIKSIKATAEDSGSAVATLAESTAASFEEVDGLLDQKLDKKGGTLTGNLTGKYITGTWLQTTSTSNLGKAPTRVAVLENGWVYYRTPQELLNDMSGITKTSAVALTIPTTGWKADDAACYPQYYDISAAGITVKDRVDIILAPGSVGTATACGLCPSSETLEGKIRIRAASVPTKSIAAEYWIVDGKES